MACEVNERELESSGWLQKEGGEGDVHYDESNFAAAFQFVRRDRREGDLLAILLSDGDVSSAFQAEYQIKAEKDRALVIELLLAMRFLPKHRGTCTALHYIAAGGCNGSDWGENPRPMTEPVMRRLIHLLCRCGVDIEARDELHGATALGFAAFFGCELGCRVLMEAGADPNAPDIYGSTPTQNAFSRHGFDLMTMVAEDHIGTLPVPSAPTELTRIHGRWAEADARCEAVKKALAVQEWCAVATSGRVALPGPALDRIAFHLMAFDLWPPTSRPLTPVALVARSCRHSTLTLPSNFCPTSVTPPNRVHK